MLLGMVGVSVGVIKASGNGPAQRGQANTGGVEATVSALRKMRGPNKKPAKEQVAIRLDQDLVSALRASGPGWQTRVNTVLKDWLACQASPGAAKPHG